MLRDGRVGYIDFGIVGRVAPSMWAAVEALLGSAASGDFVTMARALCTLGVTATDVDIPVRASGEGKMTPARLACLAARTAACCPAARAGCAVLKLERLSEQACSVAGALTAGAG